MLSTTPAESFSVCRWKIQPTGEEQDPDQIYRASTSAYNICYYTIAGSLWTLTTKWNTIWNHSVHAGVFCASFTCWNEQRT
jgi:hypothetical protein